VLLCLGSGGGYLLDTKTWKILNDLSKRTAAAFSPDGRLLALADDDEITLLEMTTRSKRIAFSGHRNRITSLAFSPDGSILASGSRDTSILLWDVCGKRTADSAAPPPRELESLWADLDGHSWKAGVAMRRLHASPEQALTLFNDKLRRREGKGLDTATICTVDRGTGQR